jgi:methionine synthase I (cobalamin-dependent)
MGAGARIVGGCCGATPSHVRALRAAIDSLEKSKQSTG